MLSGRRHIVLGSNLLPDYALPIGADAILYNLEQITPGSPWLSNDLLALFKRYTVWDYSSLNAAALAKLGINVQQVVPIGYVKQLTRIRKIADPDIDVLFIGSINERRKAVLDRLIRAGLNVKVAFGVFGAERDRLIGRAKLLLNMHFYELKVLEVVRISYYLANRCAVLSERSADLREDEDWENALAFADYQDLPERAVELCRNADELKQLASRGYDVMGAREINGYLNSALTDEPPTRAGLLIT